MKEDLPGPGLLEELKRRKVLRAAALYAAGGWAIVEVASTVLPTFNAPQWILQLLTLSVILGFPPALALAWALELTSKGLRRESDVDRPPLRAARIGLVLVTVVAASFAFFSLGRLVMDDGGPDAGRSIDDEPSVAVLPFENISRDASTEPFTIGIHDDLVTAISRINSIKTISRTSVLQYRDTIKTIPQIARELGVATILEGGVQRAGDRVRINVQLIDARSDAHLWSETYDREMSAANIFSIQSEIAQAVADALRATLTRDERKRLDIAPTQSLAAVEKYFLGKQLLERRTRESLFAAVEYFKQVTELDPEFALGYSGLADAYMLLPEYVAKIDWQATWENSEKAAQQALALDPDLPEALTSMGWNRLIHYYDWAGAEALLRRALAVQSSNPNALHWLSHVLSWQGRHAEALALARRAVEVDPNSRLMARNLSYILMDAGEFDASIALALETIERFPDQDEQPGDLWQTYMRAERVDDGFQSMVRWAELTDRDVEAAREVGLAFIRHGKTGESQTVSEALLQRVQFGAEDLGQVYAFLGDAIGTLRALETAAEERSGSRSVLSMRLNPAYDFIRASPRFQALLRKVGLTE